MSPRTFATHRLSSLDVVVLFEQMPLQSSLFAVREAPVMEDTSRRVPSSTCARARGAADLRCRSTRPPEPPALLWDLLQTLVKRPRLPDAPAEATQRGVLVANDAEVICLRQAA